MSKAVKLSGTKPSVSSKNNQTTVNPSSLGSILDIPPECAKELEAAGMEGRWIDVIQLKKNQGYHKREWSPYKFKCLSGSSGTNPFGATDGQFDGYLMRQQLVLAAKTKEKAQARRDYVRSRTQMQSDPAGMQKAKFKEYMASNIKGAKVHGFDEGDDE